MRDGEPVWRVSQTEGILGFSGGLTAAVHGGNGTVLAVHREPGFGEEPEEEPGNETVQEQREGTVTPSDAVEAGIELVWPGHVQGILEAQASDLGPGAGSVTFELLRDGEVRRSTTVEEGGAATRNLTVEDARPGEWTVRASSDDDVRDVTVTVRGTLSE